MTWQPCLKRRVNCVVVSEGLDGLYYFWASNECQRDETCERQSEGRFSFRGNACGPPRHAEQRVADQIAWLLPSGFKLANGIAYTAGHTYLCRACQEALVAVGVRTFVLVGETHE